MFFLFCTAVVWTTRAWSNRLSDDDVANHERYEQLMEPWRVPILSLVVTAFVVLGVSRLLLAVSKLGSVIVFGAIATIFFVGAIIVASRPKLSRGAVTIVLLLAALIVLGSAIGGLVAGQREFKILGEGGHSSMGVSSQVIDSSSPGVNS